MKQLLLGATLAAACCGTPSGAGPTLLCEIGTGIDRFDPLAAGAAVDIVAGPQGGFHIWNGARIHDVSVDRARVDLSGWLEGSLEPVGPPSQTSVVMQAATGGARDAPAIRNFVDRPAVIVGQRVILRLDVQTLDGRHCTDEVLVLPR